jgi:hypothetical protein
MDAVRVGLDARPEMVTAIGRSAGTGLKTAALTNNWADDPAHRPSVADRRLVRRHGRVGGRRAAQARPAHHALVCERLDVSPPATVFLDDLGANLSRRELG